MKKRTLALILAALMALTAIVVFPVGADNQSGDWGYYVNDDGTTATINRYYGSETEVTIPSTIEGYTVTKLSCWYGSDIDISYPDRGIFYNTYVTNVTIPDSVTMIYSTAFLRSPSLTSVTIPNSVTTIYDAAFALCPLLTSVHIEDIAAWCAITNYGAFDEPYNLYLNGELVTDLVIPDGVTTIAKGAFFNCASLTSVTIPDSVTTIGERAFSSSTSLTSVKISDLAAWCAITNYGAFDEPYNLYLNGELLTDLVIPDGVTTVDGCAFNNCTSLTSVVISDSVTTIGDNAFDDCTSLTSVTIGDSVTTIGNQAFSDCTSLTSVDIPDSVTSIGGGAFYNCTSLTSVTIPDSVTSIGGGAFSDCTSLTSVTIGDSVTSIGDSAFYNCTSLTSVTIPDSVTSIGEDPFWLCSSLTRISVNGANTAYKSIYGVLYTKDGMTIICCPQGKTNVTIADSVTTINYGFWGSSLTSIVIPDSVTTIVPGSFYSCNSLTTVYYTGSEEQWKNVDTGAYANGMLWSAEKVFNSVLTHDHYYTASVTAPTCTEGGYTTYTCDCGDSYTADETAVLGHALTHVAAVAAGADADGNIEYWKCDVCGKYFADDEGTTEIEPESVIVKHTVPDVEKGDLTGDGKINSRDVIAVMRLIVGWTDGDSIPAAADLNNDGKINSRDVIAIMKLVIAAA